MSQDRLLCGWRLRSELDLPELPSFPDSEVAVDIEILLGRVPGALADPVRKTPFLQIDRRGTVLVTLPGVVSYCIENPQRVLIDAEVGADPKAVRLFLYGSVTALLCHLRGLLPIHGSAVRIDGRTLVFAGKSGSGKSTVAAMLMKRGHGLLADDICIVDTSDGARPVLWPFFSHVKLWPEALENAGFSSDGLELNRGKEGKLLLPASGPTVSKTDPVPVDAILTLEAAAPGEAESVEWLSGFGAVSSVVDQLYRQRAIVALGQNASLFQDVTRLVDAPGTRVGTFKRERHFDRRDRQIAFLETLAAAL